MSEANQGQGSAVDSSQAEYHNQENMLSRLRGTLKPRVQAAENQENLPPKGNRTVLGALQNNQRSKLQNQCGTKQVWCNVVC